MSQPAHPEAVAWLLRATTVVLSHAPARVRESARFASTWLGQQAGGEPPPQRRAVAMLPSATIKERVATMWPILFFITMTPLWFNLNNGALALPLSRLSNNPVLIALRLWRCNGWHVAAWSTFGVVASVSILLTMVITLDASNIWWATPKLKALLAEMQSDLGDEITAKGFARRRAQLQDLVSCGDLTTRLNRRLLPRRWASILCNQRGESDAGLVTFENTMQPQTRRQCAFSVSQEPAGFLPTWTNGDVHIHHDFPGARKDLPWRCYFVEAALCGRARILQVQDTREAVGGTLAPKEYWIELAATMLALTQTKKFIMLGHGVKLEALATRLEMIAKGSRGYSAALDIGLVDCSHMLRTAPGSKANWHEWHVRKWRDGSEPRVVRVPVVGRSVEGLVMSPLITKTAA